MNDDINDPEFRGHFMAACLITLARQNGGSLTLSADAIDQAGDYVMLLSGDQQAKTVTLSVERKQ